jgi:hypothetical protein
LQVVLRKGLLGSLPRSVGSTAVIRLITGLDLVIDLSHLCVEDVKREGLPVSASLTLLMIINTENAELDDYHQNWLSRC